MSDRKTRETVAPCAQHTLDKLLAGKSYAEVHEIAMRRLDHGISQVQCQGCGLYLWPEEIGVVREPDAPPPPPPE